MSDDLLNDDDDFEATDIDSISGNDDGELADFDGGDGLDADLDSLGDDPIAGNPDGAEVDDGDGLDGDSDDSDKGDPDQSDPDNGKDERDGANSAEMNVNLEGDHNQTIQHLETELYQQINYHLVGQGSLSEARRNRLDESHFVSYDAKGLRKALTSLAFSVAEVRNLEEEFESQRILWLSGPAGIGKSEVALALANAICRRQKLEGTLVDRGSLEPQLRVDLHDLAGETKAFRQRVVVLRLPLQFGNPHFERIVKRADQLALRKLYDLLVAHGSFLIVTLEPENRELLHADLRARLRQIDGPSMEALAEHLKRRGFEQIEGAALDNRAELEKKFRSWVEGEVNDLVTKLARLRRIERFVREHLLSVARKDFDVAAVRQALDRMERLDRWLLEEQAQDAEALTYLLALAVCHAGPQYGPVRWFAFDHLRREFFERMRRELSTEEEIRQPQDLCSEPRLLERLGAEVVEDAAGEGPIIRFIDPQRSERIWECLLGTGRALGSFLVPHLAELCRDRRFFVRRHAAWSLARLGKLDPWGILMRHMLRLGRSDPATDDALGYLVQGALATGDSSYRQMCLGQLRRQLDSAPHEEKCTALRALGLVGVEDLKLATRELGRVMKRDLLASIKKLIEADNVRRLFAIDARAKTGSLVVQAVVSQHVEKALRQAMGAIFSTRAYRLLTSCQFAFVGLGFALGPAPVCMEMRRFMPAGKEREEHNAALLALICLRKGGVLDIWKSYPLIVEHEGKSSRQSRLAVSLVDETSHPRLMADFLFRLYLGTRQLPSTLTRWLSDRLSDHILTALSGEWGWPELDNARLNFWHALVKTPDLSFRDQMATLLRRMETSDKRKVRILAEKLKVTPRPRSKRSPAS